MLNRNTEINTYIASADHVCDASHDVTTIGLRSHIAARNRPKRRTLYCAAGSIHNNAQDCHGFALRPSHGRSNL